MSTPKLDQIAAHGNRGHHHPTHPYSTITCADGYRLSVILSLVAGWRWRP